MADEDIFQNMPISPAKKLEPINPQTDLDSALSSQDPAPFSLNADPKSANKTESVNPFDLAASTSSSPTAATGAPPAAPQGPTGEQIGQNIQQLQKQITTAQTQLQTPGLNFSDSAQQIYQYRLNRFQENVSVINKRLGIQATTPPKQSTEASNLIGSFKKNPAQDYLSYLADGQNKLNDVLSYLQTSSGKLTPGDLMAVQIKVNSAQQEIQFFSALLGQSLDALKQLMNTQI